MADLTRRCVLVVEDNPTASKLLCLALEAAGYSVLAAPDAAVALGHLGRGAADLVLQDLVLPDMDGIALLRMIRALPNGASLPVIALSGFKTLLERATTEARGFNDTRLKPAPPQDIVRLVRKHLPLPMPDGEHSGHAEPAAERRKARAPLAPSTEEAARIGPREPRATVPPTPSIESSHQTAQLSILSAIATLLPGSDDPAAVFGQVLAKCLDHGGVSCAALYGPGDGTELVLRHASGVSEPAAQAWGTAIGRSAHWLRAGRGAVGMSQCLPEGEARDLLTIAGLKAAVLLPLFERERRLGALLLGSTTASTDEPRLAAFGGAVAGPIAQALSLSESFNRLRQAAEVGRALSASLDLDETSMTVAGLATARLADVCELTLNGEPTRTYDSARLGSAPRSTSNGLLVLPLVARGRALGQMSLKRVEGARPFTALDRTSAESLASGAAQALDQALTHQAARNESRAKDEFLATVSHELRTPLSSILGWARMLKKGVEASKREHAYNVIERNAVAQAQLIEDLLDTSRIISGQMRLDLQTANLSTLVDTAVESIKPALELKNISLKRSLPESPVLVRADAARLQQVIWNLLANAAKFTPSGGHIEIEVAQQDSDLRLSVSDDGQGIPAEFLAFVFDRFRQAEGTIARSYGGLGLGLAISRHLVELHGGRIRVESEGQGRGARFTVELPSVAPQAAERPPHGESQSSHPRPISELADVAILVVDDDADTRELLLEVLANCGANARGVSSAAEAFAAVAEYHPDILLSDIGMPGEDGYALMRRLRTLPAVQGGAIPAAAITAYNRSEDRMLAFEAGFQLHVAKPIDLGELVAAAVSLSQMAAAAKAARH